MEDRDLADWFDSVSGSDWVWYVKYLSANDTYANPNVHQGGPYVAKEVLKVAFPALCERAETEENPDLRIPAVVASHAGYSVDLRLVWYNSKRLGQKRGRDEARLTRWGGIEAPVVAADSTGSLTVFAYHRSGGRNADGIDIWVARNDAEHDRIIDRVGPVEPGFGVALSSTGIVLSGTLTEAEKPCCFKPETLPHEWREGFPSGEAIVGKVVERLPHLRSAVVDDRLMKRRACEYEMFRSVEDFHVLPRLKGPFESVDQFVEYANAVTNRRKSRSGRSLELQLVRIFTEENLPHAHGGHTEGHRKPDFIFPSMERYWEGAWPDDKLRMLGAKTTVKDRWRQILNEARRVETKYLLTLQEGVSEEQFREMREEGVLLVVPASLHKSYPEAVRQHLLSLADFIGQTRQACM